MGILGFAQILQKQIDKQTAPPARPPFTVLSPEKRQEWERSHKSKKVAKKYNKIILFLFLKQYKYIKETTKLIHHSH